jgi:hypothetical protein
MIKRRKEWWMRRIDSEPDCFIGAGSPSDKEALRECQRIAADGIEATGDTGSLADLFAHIHRVAASQLSDRSALANQEKK